MKIYQSNSKGQTLANHSNGVAKYCELFLNQLNLDIDLREDFLDILKQSAFLHDIGKICNDFQIFIKKNKDLEGKNDFKGAFHNEISWKITNGLSLNNKLESFIKFIIYWHHPANCDKKGIKKYDVCKKINIEKSDLENILEYVRGSFRESKSYNEDLSTPDYFYIKADGSNLEDLAKKILLLMIFKEADQEISKLTVSELDIFLKNPIIKDYKSSHNFEFKSDDSTRTIAQMNLVDKILELDKKSGKYNPIIRIDGRPGCGKTRLIAQLFLKNKRAMSIILPKQTQCLGIYKTLEKDIPAITDSKIRMSYIYGLENSENVKEKDGSINMHINDINISTFDHVFRCIFDHTKHNEFISLLFNDLAIDEYHTLIKIPTMIYPLKIISIIKRMCKTSKIYLLSGTCNPVLDQILQCDDPKTCFKRSELPMVHEEKTLYKIEDKTEIENFPILDNSLLGCNKIETSQIAYLNSSSLNKKICHSKMIAEKKEFYTFRTI